MTKTKTAPKPKLKNQSYQATQTVGEALDIILEQKVAAIRKLEGFLFWEVDRQKRYIAAFRENYRANHGYRDEYTDADIRRFRRTLLTRGLQ
jgi:hypothetical protein